jgi:AcrR family transcriptional regulator
MPRRVDHGERREELAAAATRVIVNEGMAAASVRRISEEAGYSTGVLTRYFDTKADVILAAVEDAVARFERRLVALTAEHRGLALLEASLEADLPTDAQSIADTRLWLDVWAAAPTEPRIRAACQELYRAWHHHLRASLDQAIADGDISPVADPGREVDRLVATVDGLSLRATIDPDTWPPPALRQVLADALETIGHPAG